MQSLFTNVQEEDFKCTIPPDLKSTVFYRVQCTLFYIENDAEILPAHYAWKVAEKGFKKAIMMNKLALINSCEIIFEK